MWSCGASKTRNYGISKFFGSILDLHRIRRNRLHVLMRLLVNNRMDSSTLSAIVSSDSPSSRIGIDIGNIFSNCA